MSIAFFNFKGVESGTFSYKVSSAQLHRRKGLALDFFSLLSQTISLLSELDLSLAIQGAYLLRLRFHSIFLPWDSIKSENPQFSNEEVCLIYKVLKKIFMVKVVQDKSGKAGVRILAVNKTFESIH